MSLLVGWHLYVLETRHFYEHSHSNEMQNEWTPVGGHKEPFVMEVNWLIFASFDDLIPHLGRNT